MPLSQIAPQAADTTAFAGELTRATGIAGSTLVATMTGERKAADLAVGDKVFTRDNGAQPIRRIERMGAKMGARSAVCIEAGALGHGLPQQDMVVSPDHRLLICSERANLLLDDTEVLVAARDMVGQPGFAWSDAPEGGFLSIVLDFHEVMLCDGCWTESAETRRVAHGHGAPARRVLKRFEAQLVAGA
ncbi:Hint domain-containing protein [Maribius pontilimi]|uniref:Hint domain-containing protein n=1 Tax=Palleronia pontilimi TaxID=1964209 RepID=A0A934IJ77_9RHOB|nr:Hint domain-containing protein [Palleronia pontilimi]MBJ3762929.1 Hint domain-containing protein [Palleronia pontilimi]